MKQPNTLKNSGGVAILAKDYLLPGISTQILPSKSSDFTWLRLKKDFFNWDEDVYLGIIYISPKYQRAKLDIPNLGNYEKLIEDCEWGF